MKIRRARDTLLTSLCMSLTAYVFLTNYIVEGRNIFILKYLHLNMHTHFLTGTLFYVTRKLIKLRRVKIISRFFKN